MCVCALTTKAFIDCNMHDLLYSLSLYVAVYNHRMIVSYIYRTFTRIIAEKKTSTFIFTNACNYTLCVYKPHTRSQSTNQPARHPYTHLRIQIVWLLIYFAHQNSVWKINWKKKKQIQRFGHMTATLVAQFNPILKTKSELQW